MDQHQSGMVHRTDMVRMYSLSIYCTGVLSSPEHEDNEAAALICTDNLLWTCGLGL